MSAAWVIARLSWLRLRRGRALWILGLLWLLPPLVAAVLLGEPADPWERWRAVSEMTLRLLVTVAAAMLLAPAVAEEVESKTYTYLWSRPMPRGALLVGKLIAATPVLLAGFALSLTAAFFVALGREAPDHWGWYLETLAAAAADVVASGALAVGAGALFPRHPFVFVMGYVLVIEQLLPFVPVAQKLSILAQVGALAGLPGPAFGARPVEALSMLAILSAAWLAVGQWRVHGTEYATADR